MGDDDTDDWKTRLEKLIQMKDEKASSDKRKHDANEVSARTFMLQIVRPAFSELDAVFAQHSRRAFSDIKDFDHATLTVKRTDASELIYTLKIAVSPEGAFATTQAHLPERSRDEQPRRTRLEEADVSQLTKQDIFDDVLDCYGQSF